MLNTKEEVIQENLEYEWQQKVMLYSTEEEKQVNRQKILKI